MNKLTVLLAIVVCVACSRERSTDAISEATETPINLESIPVATENNTMHIMEHRLLGTVARQHREGILDLVEALRSDQMETVYVAAVVLHESDFAVPQEQVVEIARKLQKIIRKLEFSIPIGELGSGDVNLQLAMYRAALKSVRRLGY